MRAYRLLLRLFPASFRLEYGEEMAAIFARRRRELPGLLPGVWLWMETLGDVLANAARVHLDVLRQEFGVRMALGARPGDILHLVLKQGVLLAVAGMSVGLLLAYGAGRTLQALLAGVSPADPTTFLVTLALALLTTMAGSLWPAMRASQVDPLTVMRVE